MEESDDEKQEIKVEHKEEGKEEEVCYFHYQKSKPFALENEQ